MTRLQSHNETKKPKGEDVANDIYDIITVGGGLGGASLAKAMAEHGARVLVVEREKQFKDRIRGEAMLSWGVAETQALGLYELLRNTCAHESPRFGLYTEPEFGEPRDLIATTLQQLPVFTFSHPMMQEVLLQAAADAGAEVRRGASVREVRLGSMPTVVVEQEGRVEEIQARLIVAPMDEARWFASGRAFLFTKIPRPSSHLRGAV